MIKILKTGTLTNSRILLPGLFERWGLPRDYRPGQTGYWGDDFVSAPRQKIWWWILLSFAALIGGVVDYVIFTLV